MILIIVKVKIYLKINLKVKIYLKVNIRCTGRGIIFKWSLEIKSNLHFLQLPIIV